MLKQWLVVLGFIASAGDPQIPRRSVQLLALPDGVCTTFSINQQKGYWVTDEHCIAETEGLGSGTIQGIPTTVVMAWTALDLVVLRGPSAPALEILDDIPDPGTKVFKWGYGDGAGRPWLSTGVSTHHIVLMRNIGHAVMLFDLLIRPGDSGAPIMTYDGKVVSVAEIYWPPELKRKSRLLMTLKEPGAGVDTITLRQVLEPYLPGYVPPVEPHDAAQTAE